MTFDAIVTFAGPGKDPLRSTEGLFDRSLAWR
jgi:hypothetical protein